MKMSENLENIAEETPMNQIALIIQRDLPEVDRSGDYQCHHNPMNAFRLAMDRAETGTRREIARIMFGSLSDKPEVYDVFMQFSTEAECKTPVEGNKRYSAELDVVIEPEKVYDTFMEKGYSTEAFDIAFYFGLSDRKKDMAVLKQLQQRELKDQSTLRDSYEEQKRLGGLDKEFGKSIARLHYESLLRQEMINRQDGFYDTNFFLMAKMVAEEASLGQEFVDRAEALKPTLWQGVKTLYNRLTTGNYQIWQDNGRVHKGEIKEEEYFDFGGK